MPSSRKKTNSDSIQLHGCRQHNLRNLDLEIPLGKLTVVTGPSGSGKSSLAFHTLYAEGQRRYVETFSPYVRQFFDRMDKPDVDRIEGIPPAIAIEQKNNVRTSRSTVGTLTEINDYLKILFSRLAQAYDPETGEHIAPDTAESAAQWALENADGRKLLVTFPIPLPADADAADVRDFLKQQGYLRIYANESVLRTDEEFPAGVKLGRAVEVVQDRVTVSRKGNARLLEALEAAFLHGKGHATLREPGGLVQQFSTGWHNPRTGFTIRPPSASLFSFNSPLGACPKCRGFGRVIGLDLDKAVPVHTLSLAQGAVKPFQGERGMECQRDLMRCCRERGIDADIPWEDLSEEEQEWVYYGDSRNANATMEELDDLWREGKWYGIKGFFDWLETKAYKMHVRIFLSRYRSYTTCGTCRGARLQPEALCYQVNGKTLPQLWAMPVDELLPWFRELVATQKKPDATLDVVLKEIASRLSYLDEVGLGYLTLDRQTRTLSGGEVERVNLTTCLGASLTGTLFVLDEPTVGLHSRDIVRLTGVMHSLRDKGNTIVVVEHEERVMRAADHLIDLGPGAGQHGGQIVYQGRADGPRPPKKSARRADAPYPVGTIPWLTGEKSIAVPKKHRKPGKAHIAIRGATRNNLKKVDVDIPLGLFVCLTGVSGSGKSTLAHDVLYQNVARKFGIELEDEPARVRSISGFEKLAGVELVDQSPVSRTPRSTPAVLLGAFNEIRQLFAQEDAAVDAGYNTGSFSFNSGDGRCDRCSGTGYEKVEMQFLSDIYVTCPACDGKRYKPATLDITYLGKSIAGMLDLTITEAIELFSKDTEKLRASSQKRHRTIIDKLQPLVDVGLGYIKLGQPLNTLSGGESQRLKLCQLLGATGGGKKLLILDEPTTGLHFSDIERLLAVFQQLVDDGHSLFVIEHNLDVIKSADWLIDLGPEAGKHGGCIVGEGSPEHIATFVTPTGHFLREAKVARASCSPPAKKAASKMLAPQKSNSISLHGARHHNLKNISLEIPREQFVVVSGLSGSGKSTLAFDILFAEGQRRFLDSMSAYARQFAEQLEKPEIDRLAGLPPAVAIEQRVSQGGSKSTVATITELWNFIRLLYAKLGTLYCPSCQVPVEAQSHAAIQAAIRKATKQGDVRLLAPVIKGKKGYHTDVAKWALKQGFETLYVDGQLIAADDFQPLERYVEHDIDIVAAVFYRQANSTQLDHVLTHALEIGKGIVRLLEANGKLTLFSTKSSCPSCNRSFEELDPRLFSFNSPHGWCPGCRGHGRVPKRKQRLDLSRFDSVMAAEMDADRAIDRMDDVELVECPTCHGTRLNPVGAAVRIVGQASSLSRKSGFQPASPDSLSIAEVSRFTIGGALEHFGKLKFSGTRESMISRDILPEIRQRLEFLEEVGLSYLQLDRSGNTLSGGESQRIRLAAQLGSNLRGVLYVLDEPTIGLHPRDNSALLKTLLNLRDRGNSLVVVEHDEDTIAAADHLIDLGPAAGRLGGEVVYQGRADGLRPPKKKSARRADAPYQTSPTLRALANPLSHPMRGERRNIGKTHPHLKLAGCSANNLKNIDVAIPIGRLTVLTGISGSGKSTLMHQCVAAVFNRQAKDKNYQKSTGQNHLKACYEVDQSPIGKTSRSCPATYVKVFDHIRALFAQLPEARMRGYDASRFSFNTENGRCPLCSGNGRVKLEMDFLPATWVHCEECNGARYNPATLEVEFHGKNIGQVLTMTIDEAATFFASQPRIADPLKLMADTGLGYLQLGQPSPTLSGGEAQRIKLVSELIKGRGAKARIANLKLKLSNLYLIEEPTVGLHLEDIRRLIDILHRLVDEGHTVVVIEHHMAVAAEADWILDLGPEAGDGGGQIVAQGPPEKVAKSKTSRTAPFLKAALEGSV